MINNLKHNTHEPSQNPLWHLRHQRSQVVAPPPPGRYNIIPVLYFVYCVCIVFCVLCLYVKLYSVMQLRTTAQDKFPPVGQ